MFSRIYYCKDKQTKYENKKGTRSSDLTKEKRMEEVAKRWMVIRETISSLNSELQSDNNLFSPSPPLGVLPINKCDIMNDNNEMINKETIECNDCKLQIRKTKQQEHKNTCIGTEQGRKNMGNATIRSSHNKVAMNGVETTTPEKSKLTFPVYNLLNNKQMKEMNKKLGLNITGNREMWIRRHKEYVIQMNAQTDSQFPSVSSFEIAQKVNEETKIECAATSKKISKPKRSCTLPLKSTGGEHSTSDPPLSKSISSPPSLAVNNNHHNHNHTEDINNSMNHRNSKIKNAIHQTTIMKAFFKSSNLKNGLSESVDDNIKTKTAIIIIIKQRRYQTV